MKCYVLAKSALIEPRSAENESSKAWPGGRPAAPGSNTELSLLLDVRPDLLRNLGARRSLHTADFRQRVAELLRSENAHALLLHGRGHLLAVRLRSLCCD